MHHVIVRAGTEDGYQPAVPPGHNTVCVSFGRPGDPSSVRTNALDVLRENGLIAPAVTEDLFILAASAYCADTRIARSAGYDDWTRGIVLHLPVRQPDLWHSVRADLVEMLSFLTGDHWELRFRESRRTGAVRPMPQTLAFPKTPGTVALFSGGLDSFIGAIDRLEAGEPLGLISHHGVGVTNGVQERTLAVLTKHYPGLTTPYGFYVLPPRLGNEKPERTTRSRSVLFFALGTLVASGIGDRVPLLVPENGFISLNPPLTPARTGSASTRTTHPHYVDLFRGVLVGLGIATEVELPYRFQTKGQMAQGVLNPTAFSDGVRLTVSCSHPEVGRFRGKTPGRHCGYCVPCIIRRAALATAGRDDPGEYDRDVLTDPPAVAGRIGLDLRAFQMAARRFDPADALRSTFAVLDTGPIPPEELAGYVAVYRHGMDEISRFLGVVPQVTA